MKIVVLAGGNSTEREVSLVSGSMIYKALKKNGHQVVLVDVFLGCEETADGIFELEKDWSENISAIREESPDLNAVKALRSDNSFFGPNVISICQLADIVFLALHGENGEDGKLQATFDLLGIKYTGTDSVSSALAMDKAITKEIFSFHHIPTPKSITFHKGEKINWSDYPCMVKVPCGGSSVGVYYVEHKEKLQAALDEAFLSGDTVIIEQYVKGREFSVGVIDGVAYPIIEIAPINGFYDYKNKYQQGSTVETCPAELDEVITKGMQQVAEDVFKALRFKTYARMDFMMNEKNEYFCLEANTLPGMTPTSLLPQEAAALGISFEQLCEKIIESSFQKYQ